MSRIRSSSIFCIRRWASRKSIPRPLREAELNHVFEHYTQKNSEASLDAYLASAPAPKVAEKDILKKADGTVVAAGPRPKRKERIRPGQSPRRRTSPPPEKREVVTVTVDTRISGRESG